MPILVITLLGVLPDGSNYAPDVPTDPRTTIRVPKGNNTIIRLTTVTPGGTPVKFTGETFTLTMKKNPQDYRPVLTKVGVANRLQTPATMDFAIVPQDLKLLQPGSFVYDIQMTDGAGAVPVMPLSPWLLLPVVGGGP